jgi:hypothetical protein
VYKLFVAFLLCFGVLFGGLAFAQEPRFATLHEVATVIVDQKLSNNVTASVSLQTTSLQEFMLPKELDAKIRNNTDIIAVIITNENQCILGVQEQICVMINVKRAPGESIESIQGKAQRIGDSLINDINAAFGLDAKFHSAFVHYDVRTNQLLETSGDVSGAGTVSAVYTTTTQKTDFMFDRVSSALIPRQIRSMGGFYDVAQQLAKDENSKMAFSILPSEQGTIMQLKVSKNYPRAARDLNEIDPLQFLEVDQIKKSDYFSVGFFPLNSLVHVVILPTDNATKIHVASVIEPTVKNGQKIPSDITKNGWFFDPESGSRIDAMYLFGKSTSASHQDLVLTLGEKKTAPQTGFDETLILIGIGGVAAAAAVFYLKGIRKKS